MWLMKTRHAFCTPKHTQTKIIKCPTKQFLADVKPSKIQNKMYF